MEKGTRALAIILSSKKTGGGGGGARRNGGGGPFFQVGEHTTSTRILIPANNVKFRL